MIAQFFSSYSPSEWIKGSAHKYILLRNPLAIFKFIHHTELKIYEYTYSLSK